MRLIVVGVACLALAGCAKPLKFDEKKDLGANEPWTGVTEKFSKATTVKVEASADAPFHIFVLPEDEVTEGAETEMQDGRAPKAALGHKLNDKTASFEVIVPAGKELQFYIVPVGKKASVSLKMTSA